MPFIGSPHIFPRSLYSTIVKLGLSSNLQLCLDAGDAESYDGTSQKWLDRSGGGYDFFRGTDGTSQASDPTFNGTAGNVSSSEYFSGDGADYFSYDSTIETWMQNLGKTGNSVTVFAHVYVPSNNRVTIFGTASDTASHGAVFNYSETATQMLYAVCRSDGSAFISYGGVGPTLSPPFLAAVGFAMTLGTSQDYTIHYNGTNYNGTSAASPAVSSTNPSNNMKIFARGNTSLISASGSRIYDLAIWSSKLADADITALHEATRDRYGL
jgi:hypothetical protein